MSTAFSIGYTGDETHGSGPIGIMDRRSGDRWLFGSCAALARWMYAQVMFTFHESLEDYVTNPTDSARRVLERSRDMLEYQGFEYIGV